MTGVVYPYQNLPTNVNPKADYAEQAITKLKNDINERRRKEARTILKGLDNRPASPTDLINAYVKRVPFVEHGYKSGLI